MDLGNLSNVKMEGQDPQRQRNLPCASRGPLNGGSPMAAHKWSTSPHWVVEQARSRAHELGEWNLSCAVGLPGVDTLDIRLCLRQLDDWACLIRQGTERMLPRFCAAPDEFERSEGYFRVLVMVTVPGDGDRAPAQSRCGVQPRVDDRAGRLHRFAKPVPPRLAGNGPGNVPLHAGAVRGDRPPPGIPGFPCGCQAALVRPLGGRR